MLSTIFHPWNRINELKALDRQVRKRVWHDCARASRAIWIAVGATIVIWPISFGIALVAFDPILDLIPTSVISGHDTREFLYLVLMFLAAVAISGPAVGVLVYRLIVRRRIRSILMDLTDQGLSLSCGNCGYDLRGCPDESTTCPECGEVISQRAS